jgi:hypothetical protein
VISAQGGETTPPKHFLIHPTYDRAAKSRAIFFRLDKPPAQAINLGSHPPQIRCIASSFPCHPEEDVYGTQCSLRASPHRKSLQIFHHSHTTNLGNTYDENRPTARIPNPGYDPKIVQ